jgi:hypothetical protein
MSDDVKRFCRGVADGMLIGSFIAFVYSSTLAIVDSQNAIKALELRVQALEQKATP